MSVWGYSIATTLITNTIKNSRGVNPHRFQILLTRRVTPRPSPSPSWCLFSHPPWDVSREESLISTSAGPVPAARWSWGSLTFSMNEFPSLRTVGSDGDRAASLRPVLPSALPQTSARGSGGSITSSAEYLHRSTAWSARYKHKIYCSLFFFATHHVFTQANGGRTSSTAVSMAVAPVAMSSAAPVSPLGIMLNSSVGTAVSPPLPLLFSTVPPTCSISSLESPLPLSLV